MKIEVEAKIIIQVPSLTKKDATIEHLRRIALATEHRLNRKVQRTILNLSKEKLLEVGLRFHMGKIIKVT